MTNREELAAALKETRATAVAILEDLGPYDTTMIVLCDDLPILFQVNGNIYDNPQTTSLSEATRFSGVSYAAVERVAGQVRNGAGTRGHAVLLRAACEARISETDRLMEVLEQAGV
ncbi:MAG: hypothetical protein AB7C95_00885 [Synergistaceae bacterium]